MIPFTFTKNGRKYYRLERGDIIRKDDWQWTKEGSVENIIPHAFLPTKEVIGERVEIGKMEGYGNCFYRDITKPKGRTKKDKTNQ